MKLTPRKPSTLTESLQRHLNAYTLAASTAGVSLLALAQPAGAKIVYRPTHVVIDARGNGSYLLDLNHDGVPDFSFNAAFWTGRSSQEAYVRCGGALYHDGNWVSGGKYEAALKEGARIPGPSGAGREYATMALVFTYLGVRTVFQGPWANGGRGVKGRYLGLRFHINGKTHYGWARLNVSVQAQGSVNVTATLNGYAYETIPGKSIIAGKTHGGASLGALAAGSTALSGRRHKIRSKSNEASSKEVVIGFGTSR